MSYNFTSALKHIFPMKTHARNMLYYYICPLAFVVQIYFFNDTFIFKTRLLFIYLPCKKTGHEVLTRRICTLNTM